MPRKANVKRYEDDETKKGKAKVKRRGYLPLGNREILYEGPPWSIVLLAKRKSGEEVVLKIIKKVNKAELEGTTKEKLTVISRGATDVLTRLHNRVSRSKEEENPRSSERERKSKEEQIMEAQAAREKKTKIKRENEKQIFRIKNETKILKGLKHENIVRYLDGISHSFETNTKYYIAFAYLKGGRLLDRLEKQTVLTEKQIRNIASSLVKAVHFLHENQKTQIIHANLRSENVMFDRETSDVPVLTGFSFARKVNNTEQISIPKIGRYTDVHLVRKEMLRRQQAEEAAPLKATKEGDIWSLGVIIHLLLTGHFPFVEAEREADIDDDYINHSWQETRKLNTEAPYWENVSKDAKAFVIEMLHKSRTNRITAGRALEHQWIHSGSLPEVHLPGLRERAKRMAEEEEEIKRLDRERRERRQTEEEDGDDEGEEVEVPTRVKTPNKPTSVFEDRRSTPQQSGTPAPHKLRKRRHFPLEGDKGHRSSDDSDEVILPRPGTNLNQRAGTPRTIGTNTPRPSRTDLTKEPKEHPIGHRPHKHRARQHPSRDTYGLEGGNMSSGSGSGKQNDKKKKKDPTYSLAALEIRRGPDINAQNTNVDIGVGGGRQKVVHEVNPASNTYAFVDSPPSDHDRHNHDPGSDRFSFVPGLSDNLNNDVGDHHSYGHGHDGDGYGS